MQPDINEINYPAANISARDLFAALAMHAMLSRDQFGQADVAAAAVTYADALLTALHTPG